GGTPETLLVEFDRAGSLPTTHESQGSDMGLFGGLLGWEADDPRLPDSATALRAAGTAVRIETVDAGDPHPNTYRLTLGRGGRTHSLRAISTGGGMIEVIAIDDVSLSAHGDYHETLFHYQGEAATQAAERLKALLPGLAPRFEPDAVAVGRGGGDSFVQVQTHDPLPPDVRAALVAACPPAAVHTLAPVLPVRSCRTMSVPFSSAAELLAADAGRGTPLWQHAVAYEKARGGLSEREVIERMVAIVRLLKASIASGIAGTEYDDRVLPPQAPGFAAALAGGRLVGDPVLNRIVLATTALMEVKSSMGVIVAAPTAGACAALPAAVITLAESMHLDEEAMARALLAAGLVGVFICTPWSFAAEVGGCQAGHAPAGPRGRLARHAEHARPDLRPRRQPGGGSLPRQERDGGRQRPRVRQYGAGGIRGGDPVRRGRGHGQAGGRPDAAGTPLHGPRRPLDHAGLIGNRGPARRPQGRRLRRG
ncbi:MAG: hypothetical protein EBX36_11560, partial [Planctomycetia bacterium]|nr:hypothetical protein [Planctomycetia bacterium]